MLSKEQVIDFEEVYTKNMNIVQYWNNQLSIHHDHDVWMEIINLRSQAMRSVYLENQKQIDALFYALKEEINDEIMDELYNMLLRLFYAPNDDDAVLLIGIADALLPYYEALQDITHIINLLNVKELLTVEYFCRQTRYPEKYTYEMVHGKLYAYHTIYKELETKERRIIMANFFNLTCSHSMILPHEVNTALDIYDEFLHLMKDEEVMELDKSEEEILYLRDMIYEGIWNIAEIIEYFDKAHLLHFYELLRAAYEECRSREQQSIPYNLDAAYFYTSAYLMEMEYFDTKIDWQTAYNYLIKTADKLLIRLENIDVKIFNDNYLFNYFYPFQETTNYIFKSYRHLKEHPDSEFMKNFIRRATKVICRLPKGESTSLLYAIHAEWCENVLGVIDGVEEQRALINNIIAKGQIQTYIHSQMVALLADAILKHIIEFNPALLLTLPRITTIEMIQKYKNEIQEFVYFAAFYHDIGKSKISGVINQQTRSLVKEEFDLIKQHPEHPELGVLKNKTNFSQYYDIIAGHHKSYDGKSGYPSYFDNVHSPHRILIDLITICDCLDAATDRLGRNYTEGKGIQEVIKEFSKDKGTRYNPDIVDLILEDSNLLDELENIVTYARNEVYLQTFEKYYS